MDVHYIRLEPSYGSARPGSALRTVGGAPQQSGFAPSASDLVIRYSDQFGLVSTLSQQLDLTFDDEVFPTALLVGVMEEEYPNVGLLGLSVILQLPSTQALNPRFQAVSLRPFEAPRHLKRAKNLATAPKSMRLKSHAAGSTSAQKTIMLSGNPSFCTWAFWIMASCKR